MIKSLSDMEFEEIFEFIREKFYREGIYCKVERARNGGKVRFIPLPLNATNQQPLKCTYITVELPCFITDITNED